MIEPTVGRIVNYRPGRNDPGECGEAEVHAAIICDVHASDCVSLCVFDSIGIPYPVQHARLQQDKPIALKDGEGCAEWMAYQKGQAAKAEELEQELADNTSGKGE